VRSFESALIGKAISDADGDRRIAAQKLGIGLSSLYRKLEEYVTLGLLQDSTLLQDDSRQA
jgi:two-component system, NtrC family, response regulator AtoC